MPSPPVISVSIVICTRGRSLVLGETLASLAAVHVPTGILTELLLVENGPKVVGRDIDALLHHPRIAVRHFVEPDSGKSQKLNRAMREATGDIMLFSDDDVRFPGDWVERMCDPICAGRADAVAGGVVIARHLQRPWMNHTHRAWLASTADYLNPESPSEMCGANMAVTRKALRAVGGFDLELGPGITNGGEESLVSWQLKRAGYRIKGALNVQVEHHFDPQRLKHTSWLGAARQKGRGRAYLMHHWFHQDLRFPLVRYRYLQAKLTVRRAFTKRRGPQDEGICPWELSYEEGISTCIHYARERLRPRRYPVMDVTKAFSDH